MTPRISLVLALACSVVLLASCGGGGGGNKPMVSMLEPGTGTGTETGEPTPVETGEPTPVLLGYPDLASFTSQAPVVDLDTGQDRYRRILSGVRHVGADVAPSGSLPVVAAHGDAAVSYGTVRDGVGRDLVVEWLRENIQAAQERALPFPGLPIHSSEERTGTYDETEVTVAPGLPVVRLVDGTSEEYAAIVVRAIQAVNAALPGDWQLRMGNAVPLPDSWGAAELQDVADGELVIHMAPGSDWIAAVGRSASAGRYTGMTAREDGQLNFLRAGLISLDPEHVDRALDRFIRADPGRDWDLERQQNRIGYLAHEIVHALGFLAHPEMVSILTYNRDLTNLGGLPGHFLYPLDREGLLAAYTRLESGATSQDIAEDLGPWSDTSVHVRGVLGLSGGNEVAFGTALRNGFSQPWAYGPAPNNDLSDNVQLSGSANWSGWLLGLTPQAEAVAGTADLTVRLATLDGDINFTDLESWAPNTAPGALGTGTMWGDGDLGYTIAVRGNTFIQADGDEGIVTGAFFGAAHEAMGGTLERNDLAAGFGGKR